MFHPLRGIDAPKTCERLWIAGLLAVLALAAFLRFDGLAEPSLWLDEILHVSKAIEAAERPWITWITGPSVDRENGPLYYATQLLARKLTGEALRPEATVRLMPALAGVVAVAVLCWAVAGSVAGRWTGLAAALLLATSPLHVVYAREGRPYAAVMLAAATMLLLAFHARSRWARILTYPTCLATAYLGAVAAPLLIACCGLASLAWIAGRIGERGGTRAGRDRRSGHLALAAGLALCVLPLLFPTVRGLDAIRAHADGDTAETVEKPEHGANLAFTSPLSARALDRLLASLTTSGLDASSATWVSWLALGLGLWGAWAFSRRDLPGGLWLVGLWILPVVGWLALLQIFDHWYNVRYTSSGLPAFLALVAVGVVDLARRAGGMVRGAGQARARGVSGVVAALLLGTIVVPGARTARTEPWQKPAWRDVADLLGTLAAGDEVIVARDPWSAVCIGHYLRQQGHATRLVGVDFAEDRARAALAPHGGFVVAAGHHKAEWLEPWLDTLHPVLSRRRPNLRVFYGPDFASLFGSDRRVDRGGRAQEILERLGHASSVQEFTGDGLLVGRGWSSAEVDPEGTTFRWASARWSELALFAPGPGSRRGLRLRLRPFTGPDLPPQVVRVAVNGAPLAELTPQPGWSEIVSPPYASDRAIDHVTFDFAWLRSPRDVIPGSRDGRQLAAAFDWVAVVPAVSGAATPDERTSP